MAELMRIATMTMPAERMDRDLLPPLELFCTRVQPGQVRARSARYARCNHRGTTQRREQGIEEHARLVAGILPEHRARQPLVADIGAFQAQRLRIVVRDEGARVLVPEIRGLGLAVPHPYEAAAIDQRCRQ